MPPLEWIIQQRVERARRLLEETDATVDRIAAQAGFGTAAGMRQHFARHLNLCRVAGGNLTPRLPQIPA